MEKSFLVKCVCKSCIMPLSVILDNKKELMTEFNLSLDDIDNMTYWQFEECVKLLRVKNRN